MTDTGLAIRPDQHEWTDEQKAVLNSMGMRNIDRATAYMFFDICKRTGLDPFSRQICLIKRREKIDGNWVDKWTVQTQIAGFQVIRDRVAARLGVTVEYEDTIWYAKDGSERKVWLEDGPPAACRFVVLKDGHRFPAVVRYKAYVQTTQAGAPNSMWTRMDAEQLEKCAEAKALRRAFPNDLGGVYVEDEPIPDGEGMSGTPVNGNGHQAMQRTVAGAVEAQANARPEPEPEPPAGHAPGKRGEHRTQQPTTETGETEPRISPENRTELEQLLADVQITEPADRYRFLSACASRPIPNPARLTAGEGQAISGLIRRELEAAGGDIDQANTELWRLTEDTETGPRDAGEPPEAGSTVNGT